MHSHLLNRTCCCLRIQFSWMHDMLQKATNANSGGICHGTCTFGSMTKLLACILMSSMHNACPTYSIQHLVVCLQIPHGSKMCYERLQMPIAATILEHAPSNWSALTDLRHAFVCLWLGKWLARTMHGPLTQSNMLLSPIYNPHGYRMCHERLQMPIPVTIIGPTPSNSSVNPD